VFRFKACFAATLSAYIVATALFHTCQNAATTQTVVHVLATWQFLAGGQAQAAHEQSLLLQLPHAVGRTRCFSSGRCACTACACPAAQKWEHLLKQHLLVLVGCIIVSG
jgi:hypothetical protein